MSHLATSRNYIVFEPNDIKVYKNIKPIGTSIMMGQWLESVYVMSLEITYVDKTRKNEIANLWYA